MKEIQYSVAVPDVRSGIRVNVVVNLSQMPNPELIRDATNLTVRPVAQSNRDANVEVNWSDLKSSMLLNLVLEPVLRPEFIVAIEISDGVHFVLIVSASITLVNPFQFRDQEPSHELIAANTAFIEQLTSSITQNKGDYALFVTGPPGSGRSTLLDQMHKSWPGYAQKLVLREVFADKLEALVCMQAALHKALKLPELDRTRARFDVFGYLADEQRNCVQTMLAASKNARPVFFVHLTQYAPLPVLALIAANLAKGFSPRCIILETPDVSDEERITLKRYLSSSDITADFVGGSGTYGMPSYIDFQSLLAYVEFSLPYKAARTWNGTGKLRALANLCGYHVGALRAFLSVWFMRYREDQRNPRQEPMQYNLGPQDHLAEFRALLRQGNGSTDHTLEALRNRLLRLESGFDDADAAHRRAATQRLRLILAGKEASRALLDRCEVSRTDLSTGLPPEVDPNSLDAGIAGLQACGVLLDDRQKGQIHVLYPFLFI